MADVVQIRRDVAANWTSANPTLANGEQGYETDTSKMKVGDGATVWTSLAYFAGSGGGEANTASNSGTGAGLAQTKSGIDLPFKSLKAGTNITLNENTDDIEIVASGGAGQAIVASTYIVAATIGNDCEDPLRADYQTDGTADQSEINAAITALPT